MKKNCRLSLVGAALVLLLGPAAANAQRNFVERPGATVGVRFAGDWRAANSLRLLNREIGEVRLMADRGASPSARRHLARIARITDRLNYEYRRRNVRSWVIHRRAEALRSELRALRDGGRPRAWR